MGNETSILEQCTIDESPILKSKYWSLHHGQRDEDHAQLSVFVSKQKRVTNDDNILFQSAKNLKLYRHPSILRFENCILAGDEFYLFTEKASPLSVVLNQQSELQICLGLQNVIHAVQFLHDAGQVCHNNICQSSILVTPNGRWKLSGLEFVKKFDMVNQSFLESTRNQRYEKGISLEEKTSVPIRDHRARDTFSLGILIDEVLNALKEPDQITCSFQELAKKQLQAQEQMHRPSLSSILDHSYFKDQDYLKIVAFLTDIPLKSFEEKKTFFSNLSERLFLLPEKVVASQLSSLLLSRMVILDQTAVQCFIPNMLTPGKGERESFNPEDHVNPILVESLFKEFVSPILLKIFHVRDVQIRTILLRYFSSYFHTFSSSQLEDDILPQLLLGIRDSNDEVVSATLRALADIVPVLGATTVVGKNRMKVFSDGSPAPSKGSGSFSSNKRKQEMAKRREQRKVELEQRKKEREATISPDRPSSPDILLLERRSPVGAESEEEDKTPIEDSRGDMNEVNDTAWEDWGDQDVVDEPCIETDEDFIKAALESHLNLEHDTVSPVRKSDPVKKNTTLDLNSLDIKVSGQKYSSFKSEDNFFADMEPSIPQSLCLLDILDGKDDHKEENKTRLEVVEESIPAKPVGTKFAVADNDPDEGSDGWGDDTWGDDF